MNSERDHLDRLRGALDQCRDELGTGTIARLESARHHALASAKRKPAWPKFLLPATAMAMLILALYLTLPNRPLLPSDADSVDIELIDNGQDLDLYDQIDFYAWLAEKNGAI